MSIARHLPTVLIALGTTIVTTALVWWALTFGPTVSNDYLSFAEAGRCLVADSSVCRLATSLCGARHAVLVAAYSPLVLWLGAAVACSGLWPASPKAADESGSTERRRP